MSRAAECRIMYHTDINASFAVRDAKSVERYSTQDAGHATMQASRAAKCTVMYHTDTNVSCAVRDAKGHATCQQG